VTDFAPQQAVLARADLCITHAGLNTVLDALVAGVPLLALPIAFDQPGVAARIITIRSGASGTLASVAGQIAAPDRASAGRPPLSGQCRAPGEDINLAGGLEAAADLIESASAPHLRKLARA
jgi:zeaxanthin glucosyltransferase